jgi:phosphate starvation-inducible PhoH-like protein
MKKTDRELIIPQDVRFLDIFGPYDRYLKIIRESFGLKIILKGNRIKLAGDKQEVELAERVLTRLIKLAQSGEGSIPEETVFKLMADVRGVSGVSSESILSTGLYSAHVLKPEKSFSPKVEVPLIAPRSEGQKRYLEIMQTYDIVFNIGPAGTGKTYLAVAQALTALKKGLVKKIVLARPAVEAGERLGFLPGDSQAKVNPYLRPLYDALNSFLEFQQLRRLMEYEIIEVIPLAYMRGRNLDDAFIILDEAQNTTSEQMKMFLTRMGEHSQIVVTGDITQIDLPPGKVSGLVEVQSLLSPIKGIGFAYLTRADIVRHPLVQFIVDAYETKARFLSKKRAGK